MKNIACCFCFILIVGTALLCRAEEPAAGRWEGSVKIPDRELNVIVDLAQDNSAVWIGSIIIPLLNVKGAVVTNIVLKESDLTFAIKSALGAQRAGPATFKAHLTAANTLSGDFMQGGNTAPFKLTKTGAPQVELPARSTAIAKEIEGAWKGEFELYGPRQVTLKLANRATEGATAELIVVGQKTNNLPVDLVTQEGDSLTIESHGTGVSYEGRFSKKAGEIKGTFLLGATERPLVLHRAK